MYMNISAGGRCWLRIALPAALPSDLLGGRWEPSDLLGVGVGDVSPPQKASSARSAGGQTPPANLRRALKSREEQRLGNER